MINRQEMTKHIYENRKRFIPVIIKNNFLQHLPNV